MAVSNYTVPIYNISNSRVPIDPSWAEHVNKTTEALLNAYPVVGGAGSQYSVVNGTEIVVGAGGGGQVTANVTANVTATVTPALPAQPVPAVFIVFIIFIVVIAAAALLYMINRTSRAMDAAARHQQVYHDKDQSNQSANTVVSQETHEPPDSQARWDQIEL